MSDFDWCFAQLMGNEGGYVVDNGGPTMWGITEHVARLHGYTGDMRNLPQATAKEIARSDYWTPFGCDWLTTGLAFQVFDTAYNGGQPVQWLQAIAGVAVDGSLGPKTAAAVNAMNPWEVAARFNARRLEYFASLKQPQYSGGRMNRIGKNLRLGGQP